MKEPFTELYKGYLLKCAPYDDPSGRFVARLVITDTKLGADILITPAAKTFAKAREAAERSLAAGKDWVDNIGYRSK